MRKEVVTVEYPALIKWLRTLDAWTQIAQTSTQKQANKVIWNNHQYSIADWIELGHGLMTMSQCTTEMSESLMHFVEHGIIDPVLVAEQLKTQGWEYVTTDDYGEKEENEYFPLEDAWCMAMGCAMVLTKTALPVCLKNREWLAQGMELFYGLHEVVESEDERPPLMDVSHEKWLQTLCMQEPLVREVAAQWALENGDSCPAWPWLFDDCLGKQPSCDFIDTVLQMLDSNNNAHTDENPQMVLFQERAPLFFQAVAQGAELYTTLYGEAPDGYTEHENYCLIRAQVVSNMFPDAMAPYTGNEEFTGASSTSPSIGKLFCTDEPSNAA